jgi:hypothetical protein
MYKMIIEERFLELPEFVRPTKQRKLSVITNPSVDMLTEEQLGIFNHITNMVPDMFSQTLLTGYSGTGKTFLVSKIIEALLFKNKWLKIAITAPTNKAVRVLKNISSISEDSERVDFITLHSLLGLKRTITYEGKEEYKALLGAGDINDYKVVLVDEVSMLDNELYETLRFQAEMNKITLIFIGDRGQIPPVNGGESILFNSLLNNNFNLTKIIRQASGNPIITLAESIRTNKGFKNDTILDENNNGIVFMKIKTEQPLLEKYFKSKHFNEDPNFVKVLAWTNSAVDYYNNMIRKMIYGDDCGRLCVGEKMVCNKPITNSKNQTILNNNDEFEVLDFTLKRENRSYTFWYYEVKIKCEGKELKIKILAEKSESAFKEEAEKMKNLAVKARPMQRRNAWSKYYRLLERYADVKYNYALTVHKSQGSTFDNVIVINCDIDRIKNNKERNKLLYTAITRAKNKLFMI